MRRKGDKDGDENKKYDEGTHKNENEKHGKHAQYDLM